LHKVPAECLARRTFFRRGPIAVTAERLDELLKVNAEINGSIVPKRNTEGLVSKGWMPSPKTGDCNDYAVTKRHQLLARGWPSRALLLAEVVTTWANIISFSWSLPAKATSSPTTCPRTSNPGPGRFTDGSGSNRRQLRASG
jgi:hypothetical protein